MQLAAAGVQLAAAAEGRHGRQHAHDGAHESAVVLGGRGRGPGPVLGGAGAACGLRGLQLLDSQHEVLQARCCDDVVDRGLPPAVLVQAQALGLQGAVHRLHAPPGNICLHDCGGLEGRVCEQEPIFSGMVGQLTAAPCIGALCRARGRQAGREAPVLLAPCDDPGGHVRDAEAHGALVEADGPGNVVVGAPLDSQYSEHAPAVHLPPQVCREVATVRKQIRSGSDSP